MPDTEVAAFEQEMKDAQADFRIVKYPGALHGFTNREADEKAKTYGIPLAYQAAVRHLGIGQITF